MPHPGPEPEFEDEEFVLPVEVELYIQPDGSVVFADLADDVLPIAQELDPELRPDEPTESSDENPDGD